MNDFIDFIQEELLKINTNFSIIKKEAIRNEKIFNLIEDD